MTLTPILKNVLLIIVGICIFSFLRLQHTGKLQIPQLIPLQGIINTKNGSAYISNYSFWMDSLISDTSILQAGFKRPRPAPLIENDLTFNLTSREEDGEEDNTSGVGPPDIQEANLQPGDSHLPYEGPLTGKTFDNSDLYKEPGPINTNDPPLKKILYWNEYYGKKYFGFGFGREPFLRAGCRVNTCFATGNRNRFPLHEIDAVFFHLRSGDKSLPPKRSPHTRYVMWSLESPADSPFNFDRQNYIYNWTMTYRHDSTFQIPYARVNRRRQPLPEYSHNYAQGKTKLAALFVSHCNAKSGRDTLLKTLQQWIQVDVYGDCSKKRCPKKPRSLCQQMLKKEYKFYLSFENSLCPDYVTEKFFYMLTLDVIPVVYGLANYSTISPPHSYINVLDYPNVKDLADYILYLHNNDTAYNEYFKWKRFHIVSVYDFFPVSSGAYCDLCERLHYDNNTSIIDMKKWFFSDCISKETPRIDTLIHG